MNYRHGFHAGNFADVHKHAVLARILVHLAEKPTAFRVLDTHAGSGLYDLAGPEATRTGEWRAGIGRVQAAALAPDARALLKPYLDAVGPWVAPERPAPYPGSPLLALKLMRPQDRLIACEAEPGAARELTHRLSLDRRAKAITIDGWTALSAYVPPKERRGVVLIDPPFELADEFERLPERIATAHRKWATGIYLVWYPIKDRATVERFAARMARTGIPKVLHSQLLIASAGEPAGLAGSGLMVVNPPWRLAEELAILAPALAILMRRDGPGRARLDWLAGGP